MGKGAQKSIVLFLEGPLLEVPLYNQYNFYSCSVWKNSHSEAFPLSVLAREWCPSIRGRHGRPHRPSHKNPATHRRQTHRSPLQVQYIIVPFIMTVYVCVLGCMFGTKVAYFGTTFRASKIPTLELCLCLLFTVCCSAGIGRTGAFCALSTAIEKLKAEQMVDVFHTIKHLRTQRPHMVQNVVSANSIIAGQLTQSR